MGTWNDFGAGLEKGSKNQYKKFRPAEIDSFIAVENKFKLKTVEAPKGQNGDIKVISGPKEWEGKIIDTSGLRKEAISAWKRKPGRSLNKFKEAIDDHFIKMTKSPPLDIYILYLKYFDEIDPLLRKKVLEYVYDSKYKFSKFVNEKHFKIIN
ncbi:hypothetical protein [Tenacibaculum ovolyticum]|uniref:hypothetical protein n=1 Tax=Tenacibaculum ovolyticum TaxID=104270 RepID=UPI0003FDD9FE|nr:hypothetical protein [Tenacibaculum ovolyticum]